MASKTLDTWNVLPHGPIEPLAENLWRVKGALPGMSLERVMTIVRRSDGSLVLHSAIALEEAAMRELEALGNPAFLIVPNRWHRLDAPAYKKRYPALRVFGPRGGRKAIERVVRLDGTYEDFPQDDAVRIEPLRGVKDEEGVMVVRSRDGATVVLTDIVFNMDRKRDLLGWLITSLFASAGGPRISRFGKLLLINDRDALRADLHRFADRPDLVRLIVAHEKVASGAEAASALREATGYL